MKPFDDDGDAVARQHARQAFVAANALAVLFRGNNSPSALYGVFRAAFWILIAAPDPALRPMTQPEGDEDERFEGSDVGISRLDP